jgi:hypothetical protein
MVDIGSIRGWQPGNGPVTTWTASPTSREAMALARQDRVPPSFQQADHLRTAQVAKERGRQVPRLIMASWNVDGVCDIAAMTHAINFHIRRHDTYHSAFDVHQDTVTRRTIDNPESIEFIPTDLGFMTADAIRDHVLTATPNTLEWDCFTFGVIQKADHFTVYANIDHLHTDGSSAVVVYHDINLAYHEAVRGLPALLPHTAGYRDFCAKQNLQVDSMDADSRPMKDWADFAVEAEDNWPSFPLELGATTQGCAGGVVTVELLNAAETQAFDNACHVAGSRFSGGVMACAAWADHVVTGADVFHGFTPSDSRSGDAQALSAGWYASIFPISVAIEDGSFGMMARAAQKSFDANKHLAAVPFKRAMDLAADQLGPAPANGVSMMVSLMDFRKMAGANASRLGIYIDMLSHGTINMWVSRNADQTLLTVSYPDTPEARQSVSEYIGLLRSAFVRAIDLPEDWTAGLTDEGLAYSA